jgi:hypothetical protein
MQTVLDLERPEGERSLLDHTRGYLVQSARGRLGIVGEVEPSGVALRVGMRDGRQMLLVPYDAVALVDPHERRVFLRRRT